MQTFLKLFGRPAEVPAAHQYGVAAVVAQVQVELRVGGVKAGICLREGHREPREEEDDEYLRRGWPGPREEAGRCAGCHRLCLRPGDSWDLGRRRAGARG